MRIDFNQNGSWRKGPDFNQRAESGAKASAAWLADLADAKLRLVDDAGNVVAYRDPGKPGGQWRETKTRWPS